MDDKKNENEKIMKYISTKLKQGEIPLMLQSVFLFNKSIKDEAKLVITSTTLYFLQTLSIKKYIKASVIDCVAVTPFSNELVIFYDNNGDQTSKEVVRIQSEANFKIIQDIISVREKFCEMKEQLAVIVSSNKTLESLAVSNDTNKRKFFGFLFKKKEEKIDLRKRFSGEGEILYVNHSNFALEIGEKMYNYIYQNVKLLYISNSQNFRFFEERYDAEELSPNKRFFRLSKEFQEKEKEGSNQNKSNFLMRKINKKSDDEDNIVRAALRSYKNEEYKQELLFAIETETHFEILTAMEENDKDCQSYLLNHEFLSEKDLRSIFFKLVEMIESTNEIFHSLGPQNIIIGRHGFRISKIFSCLKRRTEPDYLSPEQLCNEQFSEQEAQLINVWKIGILMFQLAYGNVPFAAEYVADIVISGKQDIEIRFPFYTPRTQEFQEFIKYILKVPPLERGITNRESAEKANWKSCLMRCSWLKPQ